MKNAIFWDVTLCGSCRLVLQEPHGVLIFDSYNSSTQHIFGSLPSEWHQITHSHHQQ
jgi:hypothetical protein